MASQFKWKINSSFEEWNKWSASHHIHVHIGCHLLIFLVLWESKDSYISACQAGRGVKVSPFIWKLMFNALMESARWKGIECSRLSMHWLGSPVSAIEAAGLLISNSLLWMSLNSNCVNDERERDLCWKRKLIKRGSECNSTLESVCPCVYVWVLCGSYQADELN